MTTPPQMEDDWNDMARTMLQDLGLTDRYDFNIVKHYLPAAASRGYERCREEAAKVVEEIGRIRMPDGSHITPDRRCIAKSIRSLKP